MIAEPFAPVHCRILPRNKMRRPFAAASARRNVNNTARSPHHDDILEP
jgi:hypothetical protein